MKNPLNRWWQIRTPCSHRWQGCSRMLEHNLLCCLSVIGKSPGQKTITQHTRCVDITGSAIHPQRLLRRNIVRVALSTPHCQQLTYTIWMMQAKIGQHNPVLPTQIDAGWLDIAVYNLLVVQVLER